MTSSTIVYFNMLFFQSSNGAVKTKYEDVKAKKGQDAKTTNTSSSATTVSVTDSAKDNGDSGSEGSGRKSPDGRISPRLQYLTVKREFDGRAIDPGNIVFMVSTVYIARPK
jgi:hypothetical protein